MIKIIKIGSSLPLLLSLSLMGSISACNEAKTSSDAPGATTNDKATKDDAQSDTRRKQL
jgi:hypothetical protein